jgi:hypothetical protein
VALEMTHFDALTRRDQVLAATSGPFLFCLIFPCWTTSNTWALGWNKGKCFGSGVLSQWHDVAGCGQSTQFFIVFCLFCLFCFVCFVVVVVVYSSFLVFSFFLFFYQAFAPIGGRHYQATKGFSRQLQQTDWWYQVCVLVRVVCFHG